MRHEATWSSKGKDSVTVGSADPNATDITWPNDHTVMAYTYASCGDEGTAVKGTGDRQYALFYVLEGGSVTCNDNH